MSYEFTIEEYKNLDNYLLYELGMSGVLSVPTVKKIKAKNDILKEELSFEDLPVILQEEEGEPPRLSSSWDNQNKAITLVHGSSEDDKQTSIIPVSVIEREWNNLSNSRAQHFLASIGMKADEMDRRSDSSLGNLTSRIGKIYNDFYADPTPGVRPLAKWGQRRDDVMGSPKRRKEDQEEADVDPTFSALDTGRNRRTKSNVASKLNSMEILPGEFYRDHTMVSRSRLSKWVRFWRKDLNRVPENRKSLLGSLIGRSWSKTFLLGYNASSGGGGVSSGSVGIFYEVWYNSLDSSFSVYDMNGIEKTHPVPTLQEAIRLLVRIIAQEAPGDEEIFSSGEGGRQLANSLNAAFSKELRPTLSQKTREDELLTKELQRERKERVEVAAQKRQVDQVGRSARNATQDAKTNIKTGVNMAAGDAYSGIRRGAAKARSGAQKATDSAADYMDSKKFHDRMDTSVYHSLDPKRKGDTVKPQDANNKRQAQELTQSIKRISDSLQEDWYKLKSIADGETDIEQSTLSPYFSDIFQGMTATNQIEERASKVEVYLKNYLKNMETVAEAPDASLDDVYKFMNLDNDHASTFNDITDLTRTKSHAQVVKKKALGDLGQQAMDRIPKSFKESLEVFEDIRDKETLDRINAERSDVHKQEDEYQEQRIKTAREIEAEYGADTLERLQSQEADAKAREVRQKAKNSPYNKQMLIQDISDSIESYDVTRIGSGRSVVRKFLDMFPSLRGRDAMINNPLGKPGIFNRTKQFFLGRDTRADFITGYSLNNVINLEIWYITEYDKGSHRMISSFYVLDVSSSKWLRSHLPFLRSAMMTISAKLGVGPGL